MKKWCQKILDQQTYTKSCGMVPRSSLTVKFLISLLINNFSLRWHSLEKNVSTYHTKAIIYVICELTK